LGLEIDRNLIVKKSLVNIIKALDEEMDSRWVRFSQVYKLPKICLLPIVKMFVRFLVFCLLFVQIICKFVVK